MSGVYGRIVRVPQSVYKKVVSALEEWRRMVEEHVTVPVCKEDTSVTTLKLADVEECIAKLHSGEVHEYKKVRVPMNIETSKAEYILMRSAPRKVVEDAVILLFGGYGSAVMLPGEPPQLSINLRHWLDAATPLWPDFVKAITLLSVAANIDKLIDIVENL